MAYRRAVNIRRNDGQVKQCEIKYVDGTYCKKSSRDVFVERMRIKDFVDGTQSLIVCEKQSTTIECDPFVRKLPGCLSQRLFFGDLLLVYRNSNNGLRDFILDDMTQILHPGHNVLLLFCFLFVSLHFHIYLFYNFLL